MTEDNFYRVENAGHWVHFDQTKEFLKIVDYLLAKDEQWNVWAKLNKALKVDIIYLRAKYSSKQPLCSMKCMRIDIFISIKLNDLIHST